MKAKAESLRSFFANSANSVTREKIFFHRLSFDLTIAAALAGSHLNIYEPEVDRDGFDIVVEDEDGVGWYQTKAVLSSAKTARWKISVGFLRPDIDSAEDYLWDPAEAGRGGGVILVEILDETPEGSVTYRYTDFHILTAIAEGYLVESPYNGPGRRAKGAREAANEMITGLRKSCRKDKVALTKQLFVTAGSVDHLMGMMGRKSEGAYGMYAIKKAYKHKHEPSSFDDDGRRSRDADQNIARDLVYHMKKLCKNQSKKTKRKCTLFGPARDV